MLMEFTREGLVPRLYSDSSEYNQFIQLLRHAYGVQLGKYQDIRIRRGDQKNIEKA